MTIEQVAEASGLTKGFLSRLERDESSPSVATLVSVCQVLSLPVGSLFEEPTSEVIALATAPLINMGGTGAIERLLTPRSESRAQLLRSVVAPGSSGGRELYSVNCEIEILHVLSGTVSIRFVGRTTLLHTGDTVTFPGHEPHSWSNDSDEPAELVWVLAPAAWSGSS